MRRVLFLVLTMILLPGVIFAQTAPDGFGGLKWGTTVEEFKNVTDPPMVELRAQEDNKDFTIGYRRIYSIGKVSCWGMHYTFYKGRLFRVHTSLNVDNVDRESNFRILRESLTMKYGKPKQTPIVLRINPNAKVGMEYNWDLGKVWINLSWNDIDKDGFLTYTYLSIQKEFMRDEKKAAEKTKDHL